MSKLLKADFHLHTIDDPTDGRRMVVHTAQELILRASSLGFDVLSITNHDVVSYSEEIEEFAADHGIVLIPGVEATIEGRHMLLYNFPRGRESWASVRAIRESKTEDRLVIAPHPFHPVGTAIRKKLFEWIDFIDALEWSSLCGRWINPNRRGARIAEQLGLPLVANSDLHFLYQLGHCYTLVESEQNPADIIQAVKAGKVRTEVGDGSELGLIRWFFHDFYNKLRYRLNGKTNPYLSACLRTNQWGVRPTSGASQSNDSQA